MLYTHAYVCPCSGKFMGSRRAKTHLLWSILEKSRMSPRIVSSVSPLSKIVSASSLQKRPSCHLLEILRCQQHVSSMLLRPPPYKVNYCHRQKGSRRSVHALLT